MPRGSGTAWTTGLMMTGMTALTTAGDDDWDDRFDDDHDDDWDDRFDDDHDDDWDDRFDDDRDDDWDDRFDD